MGKVKEVTIHQIFTFQTANSSVTFKGEKGNLYNHWILFIDLCIVCTKSQRLLEREFQYAWLLSQ